jgi:hypothetical protein
LKRLLIGSTVTAASLVVVGAATAPAAVDTCTEGIDYCPAVGTRVDRGADNLAKGRMVVVVNILKGGSLVRATNRTTPNYLQTPQPGNAAATRNLKFIGGIVKRNQSAGKHKYTINWVGKGKKYLPERKKVGIVLRLVVTNPDGTQSVVLRHVELRNKKAAKKKSKK